MPLPSPMLPPAGPPSPTSPPTGNPGQVAVASAKIREAIAILEKALPELPTGGPQHEACVESLRKLSKAFPATDHMPGIQNATLMGLQREAREGGVMQSLMKQMGSPTGGPPQPPPGGPGTPPGGAAPPPMM